MTSILHHDNLRLRLFRGVVPWCFGWLLALADSGVALAQAGGGQGGDHWSGGTETVSLTYTEMLELDEGRIRRLVAQVSHQSHRPAIAVSIAGFSSRMSYYILEAAYFDRLKTQKLMTDMDRLKSSAQRKERLREEHRRIGRTIERMKRDKAEAEERARRHAASGAGNMARLTREAVREDETSIFRLTQYSFFLSQWLAQPMEGTIPSK